MTDTIMTAIDIKTDLWNEAIKLLLSRGWTVTYKYDNFDAGIDFDFLIFEKNNEEILFGWDNWFEGEIQCSENNLKIIEELLNTKLQIGDPVILKPKVIQINKKWKLENKWNNSILK